MLPAPDIKRPEGPVSSELADDGLSQASFAFLPEARLLHPAHETGRGKMFRGLAADQLQGLGVRPLHVGAAGRKGEELEKIFP